MLEGEIIGVDADRDDLQVSVRVFTDDLDGRIIETRHNYVELYQRASDNADGRFAAWFYCDTWELSMQLRELGIESENGRYNVCVEVLVTDGKETTTRIQNVTIMDW
jgi:hypothetical protein